MPLHVSQRLLRDAKHPELELAAEAALDDHPVEELPIFRLAFEVTP